MKEAVHHVEDQPAMFANLHGRLSPGGRLLLVHVPPQLDYLLFETALQRSLTWHADPRREVELLREAGFAVERDRLDYRTDIPKPACCRIVAGRYMSPLSTYSDDELQAGLAEMAERYADRMLLELTDRIDYITANKH